MRSRGENIPAQPGVTLSDCFLFVLLDGRDCVHSKCLSVGHCDCELVLVVRSVRGLEEVLEDFLGGLRVFCCVQHLHDLFWYRTWSDRRSFVFSGVFAYKFVCGEITFDLIFSFIIETDVSNLAVLDVPDSDFFCFV